MLVKPVLALVLLISNTTSALAEAISTSWTWQGETESFIVFATCADPDGVYEATVVTSGTGHIMESDQTFQHSGTVVGTARLVPLVSSSPAIYEGRFAETFTWNGTHVQGNEVQTYGFSATGSVDGVQDTFHMNLHVTVSPTGDQVYVENFQWFCI